MLFPQFLKSTASTVAALLPLLLNGVQGARYNTTLAPTGFPPCDALVAANLSHILYMPTSSRYTTLVNNGSWAPDTKKQPWCFVVPSTTGEVSRALTAIRSAGEGVGDWHVAIRSGGHGSDSQNNIVNGVTIDLTGLNATTYHKSSNIASIGPGARWGLAYAELEKSGVLVTGGREGVVGVGGLTLGGGISWTTAKTGFACDSVVNFEVVLASGEVANANATANSDLWRALKGGGNNFAIVTRFDFEAFPAKNLSVERRYFSQDHSNELIDAIAGFTDLDRSYADNAMIAILTYNGTSGKSTIAVTEINTQNNPNSTAFAAFNSISTIAPIEKKSQTLSDASNNTQLSNEYRSVGAGSLTLINDPRVMRFCYQEHDSLVKDMQALLGSNFTTILDFQPFPAYFASISVERGGNMLGLERDPRNKIMFVLGLTLTGTNSDEMYPRVYQRVAAATRAIEEYSKSINSSSSFRYLPYSDARQDILGTYGPANLEHMKRVAEKYDPQGFFQRRVPGGFKLDRVTQAV